MAQPTALQGPGCRVWINGIEVVEATDVAFSQPRPIGQKFGAAGLIGAFQGQAGSRIEITFAQVADRSQFEVFAFAQQDPLTGFTLVFTKGTSKFIAQFCFAGDASMRHAYESNDTTVSLSITAGPIKQIA